MGIIVTGVGIRGMHVVVARKNWEHEVGTMSLLEITLGRGTDRILRGWITIQYLES